MVTYPELMNAKETAAFLGMSRSSLYRMDATGRIPMPRKIGRMVRWSRSELIAWSRDGCKSRNGEGGR